jgi:spoIIIJ-associated protein
MNESKEEAILYAKKYLEDLIAFFGLNIDVHASSEEDVIQLSVPSTHMNGFLIGQKADNIRSFQYLTSMSLKNKNFVLNRVNVDIADYKKQRSERLVEKAEEWVKKVKESSEPLDLNPMNAADRRIIHKLAAEYGLSSDSVGEGRERHIVLKPAK